MRTTLFGLAILGLSGCDIAAGLPSLTSLTGSAEPVRAMTLLGGSVVAQAPDGYCIDQASSGARQGFVVMAGCALLSEEPVMPFRDGLITVQVGDAGTAGVAGGEQALRDLLTSPEGVGLLSATGDPATISVDTLFAQDNLVTVHFTDLAPPPFDGLEQLEWRAFFDLGDRISTVTVRGFARAPLSENAGLGLLQQAVTVLKSVNAAEAAQAEGQEASATDANEDS